MIIIAAEYVVLLPYLLFSKINPRTLFMSVLLHTFGAQTPYFSWEVYIETDMLLDIYYIEFLNTIYINIQSTDTYFAVPQLISVAWYNLDMAWKRFIPKRLSVTTACGTIAVTHIQRA